MGVIVSSRKSRGGTGPQIALGFLLSFIFILFFTLFRTFAETWRNASTNFSLDPEHHFRSDFNDYVQIRSALMATRTDYLKLHFIVFLWGFSAILGKLVSIPAVEMVFYRSVLAAIGYGDGNARD